MTATIANRLRETADLIELGDNLERLAEDRRALEAMAYVMSEFAVYSVAGQAPKLGTAWIYAAQLCDMLISEPGLQMRLFAGARGGEVIDMVAFVTPDCSEEELIASATLAVEERISKTLGA